MALSFAESGTRDGLEDGFASARQYQPAATGMG
jgi:hypothetical protein